VVEEAGKGAGAEQREREQVLREDLAEAERRLEAAVGFTPFAGMAPAPSPRLTPTAGPSRAEQQKAKRRERKQALRREIVAAERRMQEAEEAMRRAEHERESAERTVTTLQAEFDRID